MYNDPGKRFKKNLFFAFLAQGTSFLFSMLMSILVPKLLGVEQYAYWQLFIFYGTYVGLSNFGLMDGVYLRYGGIELEEMDKESVASQFKLMVIWQILLCIAVIFFMQHLTNDIDRQFVWISTAVFLVVANATWFWGYVFQAANRTSVYSISTIISKAVYVFFILFLVIRRTADFRPYICLYIIAQIIALIYVLWNARKFLLSKMLPIKLAICETFSNIKIGINLTISNIMSSLILGVGRIMVDHTSGISSFGLLSLSISLTNFFLQFISQTSMVMFPALRQVDDEQSKTLFTRLRSGISYLVCAILIFYVPLKLILNIWLPKYKVSLYYMNFLLPICVFDGKMQLIYNTYLKVYRKERSLLLINLASLGISIVLCAIGAYGFRDIRAVSIAMMIAIVSRSVIASIYLSKLMKVGYDVNLCFEILLTVIFILTNLFFPEPAAFIIYLTCYLAYLFIMRKDIQPLLAYARKM